MVDGRLARWWLPRDPLAADLVPPHTLLLDVRAPLLLARPLRAVGPLGEVGVDVCHRDRFERGQVVAPDGEQRLDDEIDEADLDAALLLGAVPFLLPALPSEVSAALAGLFLKRRHLGHEIPCKNCVLGHLPFPVTW